MSKQRFGIEGRGRRKMFTLVTSDPPWRASYVTSLRKGYGLAGV
jgi:hypothetical protein